MLLAQGKNPEKFGCRAIDPTALISLSFHRGQAVHIDHYGNIKVWWKNGLIVGQQLNIRIPCHSVLDTESIKIPVVRTFSDVPADSPLALLGSNGTLELAVNLGRADEHFGVQLEDILRIGSFKRSDPS